MNFHLLKRKMVTTTTMMLSVTLVSAPTFAQKSFKAGDTFKDCPDCPEMVVIPAGTFMMGSPENERGRSTVEGPQRTITIKQFAVGKFDITLAQWKRFVDATNYPIVTGCAFSGFKDTALKDWDANPNASWQHLGFPQDDNHPVVCISWNDAQNYIKWLNKKTGKTYRLLTEAEWEYAARAGTSTPYPWDSVASHEYANYGADSGWIGIAIGRDKWKYTSPVGSFPPNAFGLYDMQGNVLQYVEDCFSPTLSELPSDGSAYKADVVISNVTGRFSFMNGKRTCESRIVRGGDWGDPPRMIRSAYRNWAPGPGFTIENYRSGGVGFRVAREL
jgi:formylglycine-generating enzyme required for sulfatase activity